ncbi:hypothetical protein SAMN05446037_10073 [Anaerovirgula multivorans]|uniref:S1 motif domain-containing protein n=1 Tax=Anaerovirgula multivorans TaxID=312168 RepID=A0A239D4M8_9FIRM|nr:S1-like domain-containing RNA-binding protein [Anaerovirgula multivorans]SNS27466.1 hypothetical protein SAMN05446037_10073 [Anaerovirgula multivorans]
MIKLGELQKLQVVKSTEIGVYLNSKDQPSREGILLPQNQVEEGLNIGDELEVFVYKDSQDRMIATTKKPKIHLGEVAFLKVVEVTKIGAFLDWGLEKDLLLPFKEQTKKVQQGREYLVGMYIDKSDRLCATMNISKILSSESPYKVDDRVRGIIYSLNRDIGAFVAVENKYQGLIPKNELYGDFEKGDRIEARVAKLKEDGKLDLSIRERAYKHIEDDAQLILNRLQMNRGFLQLNDDSSPQKIKEELNISKNAFKKAVGRLLKEGRIKIKNDGIEIIRK